jgi:hypothetical protein
VIFYLDYEANLNILEGLAAEAFIISNGHSLVRTAAIHDRGNEACVHTTLLATMNPPDNIGF